MSGSEPRTQPDADASMAELEQWRHRAGDVPLLGDRKRRGGHFFDYIWLIYSVFFIIDPIERKTLAGWVGFAAAYAVFLVCYFGIVWSRRQGGKLAFVVVMTLLGLVYFRFNQGAAGIFIYVAALVPFAVESISFGVGAICVSALLTAGEGMYLHYSPWSWGICGAFCVTVGAANLVAAQRMRTGRKLGLAQEQIAHLAKVAERERIARDLHDVLGHTLSLVVLKSELAGKVIDRDPERARGEIREVEQIARKALGEVREAIRGYRSEGLAAEIDRARTILDAAGVTLECEAKPPHLAPAEETVLSLIVREAVTNIVRHAQASRCRLDFQANGGGTALVVEDDGRGGIRAEGNGLRGMRERVESMGGRLRIDSGQGTRLLIEIPPQSVRS